MSKKIGIWMVIRLKKLKLKKAISNEIVGLCSLKAKNTVEISLLYIKFCFVKLWPSAFSKQSTLFWLRKKDKNLTKPNQIIVDMVIDKNMTLVILIGQDKNIKKTYQLNCFEKIVNFLYTWHCFILIWSQIVSIVDNTWIFESLNLWFHNLWEN